MLLGGDHPRDGERRQRLGLVVDILDLEPDHGELVGELFDGLVGVEMLLQPGEGELHELNPPARVGTSSGLKPYGWSRRTSLSNSCRRSDMPYFSIAMRSMPMP